MGWVRFATIIALLLPAATKSLAATTCTYTAAVPVLHAEGLAEQIGDISVTCGGSATPTSSILIISVNATITNRLAPDGSISGLTVTGGATVGTPPILTSATTILFDSLQVGAGGVVFTVSGIRIAVPTVAGGGVNTQITATVVGNALGITGLPAVAGVTRSTLQASVLNYGVPCGGSPTPATIDFPTLLATGTSSSAIRVTQASAGVFTPKSGNADSGVRFLVTLSGYGSSSHVYVADVITGNQAPVQTSAGQFNTAASAGTFTPGNNQMLMARVVGADATGAGGGPYITSVPAVTTSFTTATEIPLVNGAGTVTYEVLAANAIVNNSAQIPVFVAAPPTSCTTAQANSLSVMVAPVSSVAVPTQTDPIPRFVATTPPSDCTAAGDCSAGYFPVLQVAPASISLSSTSLGPQQDGFITVTDGGTQATQLNVTISVAYQPGTNQTAANWLSLNGTVLQGTSPLSVTGVVDPAGGINSFVVRLTANPAALLIPSSYQALATVNAGSAGTVTVPVTFNVGPAGPVIQSLVNSANGQAGPVTAGSFASLYGLNLVAANSLTVTFNGFPAVVSFSGRLAGSSPGGANSQVNLLVPAQLGNAATAGVIANVDGVLSNTFAVSLVQNAPAVFNPGILNQDNTVNLASGPASRGDIVQIFLTGLATPVTSPPVTVGIGDQTLTAPQVVYVGAVPSIPGLEQINVQIPVGLTFTGNSAPLTVCIPIDNGKSACSAPVSLYLH